MAIVSSSSVGYFVRALCVVASTGACVVLPSWGEELRVNTKHLSTLHEEQSTVTMTFITYSRTSLQFGFLCWHCRTDLVGADNAAVWVHPYLLYTMYSAMSSLTYTK